MPSNWKYSRVLFLVCSAACASQPAPPPTAPAAPARARLTDTHLDTIGEIIRLEDRRELDVARFSSWLASAHPEIRSRAAIGAGRIMDRRAAPLLIGALNDSDAAVRANVAFALGKLNDSSPVVIQSLAQYARRPGEEGVEASAALGRLDSLAARPALEAIITDPTVSARAKQEALLGFGKLHPKPQTLDLMQPFVASTDVETRWRAVYALTRGAADPSAVPLLIRLLSDSDALVRALAVRGLRAAAADSAKARPETMAALRNALADPHPHVRVNAVTALGGYRSNDNVAAISALLRDADGNVALAAAQALGANGGGITALAETARGPGPIGVRNAALTALTRTPEGRAVARDIAREWLRSPSPWITPDRLNDPARLQRIFGLALLTGANAADNADLIRQAVNGADPAIASAALSAVVSQDTVSPPYALFIEKLAHRDADVRAAAIRGLRRRSSPSDLELFLRAYDRGQQDVNAAARLAAVDALGALARG